MKVVAELKAYGLNGEIKLMETPYNSWYCAYIDLPPSHPWHGEYYDSIPLDVHGGLTYSEANGELWRIGWDYAHYEDENTKMIDVLEDLRKAMHKVASSVVMDKKHQQTNSVQ